MGNGPRYLASWKFEIYEQERGPLRYKAITGLTEGQLSELTARVHEVVGDLRSGGRPYVLGLFKSVVMVVALMRRNLVQDVAGAFFGKAQCPGFNVQIAADLDGRLAAVGVKAVHGGRHDAHAYAASGLADLLADIHAVADSGYVGVDGIDLVPYKKPRGRQLHASHSAFNTALSGIRATVERAVAHLKTWRMLSEEGGRYRAPVHKFPSALKTISALHFFADL